MLAKPLGKSLSIVLISTLITISTVPFSLQSFANEEQSPFAPWTSMIDEMLAGKQYIEGEVIAIFDKTKLRQSPAFIEDMDAEVIANVSDDAIEETFDVDVKKSESAGTVQLISKEGKSTREILMELACNPAVIWAEPNYIRQETKLEDEDETENADKGIHDGMDINAPATQSKSEDGGALSAIDADSPITKVLPQGTPQDLLSKQEYSTIGDLSHLQWGYGRNDKGLYSINSPRWNQTNSKNVSGEPVVAVVDSGIDYTHPEFNGLIMNMSGYSEKGGPKGYNCSGEGSEDDPMDDNGHGTHCAGIIASAWDGIGTSGVASGVKLCIVKTSVRGSFEEANIIRSFLYLADAVDKGLNLYSVNCSFGGDGYTNAELLMANELGKRGVITCVASGNSAMDGDDFPSTSSDFSVSPYTILVDSANANHLPSDFSNYGQTTTDIFSPGDSILSPVCTRQAKYFASVDNNRKHYDSFNTNTPEAAQVKITHIGTADVSTTESYYFETLDELKTFIDGTDDIGGRTANTDSFDKDGYSYVVDVEPMNNSNLRDLFLVSVPINETDCSEISHFSFALKSTLNSAQAWIRTIRFSTTEPDETATNVEISGNSGWLRPSNVWVNMSQGVANGTDEGNNTPCPYYNGRMYFLISICDYGATGQASKLYIDSIGAGKHTLRYAYLQGTSMATPAITGSTAIMYNMLSSHGRLTGMTPAQKAEYVASVMKASVQPQDAYKNLCASNGEFRFGIKTKDYTPVINSVNQEGNILVIKGRFFGSSRGTVNVGKSDCVINSWSRSEVRVTLPNSTTNERTDLHLTARNGKTATRKIVTEGFGGKALFDKTVVIPDELKNCHFSSITGLDGRLYVAPETMTMKYTKPTEHRQFWCYDPVKDEWQRLEDFPVDETYDNAPDNDAVALTTYKGLIAATAVYNIGEKDPFTHISEKKSLIFLYNPNTNVWTEMDLSNVNLPMGGSVFATDAGLFYHGGYTKNEDLEESYNIYKLNFNLNKAKSSLSQLKVDSVTDAGFSKDFHRPDHSVSSYGNRVVVKLDGVTEWLTWSDKENKFISEGSCSLPYNLEFIGGEGKPVAFIASYTCALTADGLLISGLNGDNYTKRGYDSFYYTQDGKVTPFDKNAYSADLYSPIACVTDDYYYIWGDTYYNNDTIGHLAYTKIRNPQPDPKPDPVSPTTGDTDNLIIYLVIATLAAALMVRYRKTIVSQFKK